MLSLGRYVALDLLGEILNRLGWNKVETALRLKLRIMSMSLMPLPFGFL